MTGAVFEHGFRGRGVSGHSGVSVGLMGTQPLILLLLGHSDASSCLHMLGLCKVLRLLCPTRSGKSSLAGAQLCTAKEDLGLL
jgi:hypothetical protein